MFRNTDRQPYCWQSKSQRKVGEIDLETGESLGEKISQRVSPAKSKAF